MLSFFFVIVIKHYDFHSCINFRSDGKWVYLNPKNGVFNPPSEGWKCQELLCVDKVFTFYSPSSSPAPSLGVSQILTYEPLNLPQILAGELGRATEMFLVWLKN